MKSNAMIKTVDTHPKAVMPMGKVLTLRQRDPWREATSRAREVATHRETIVSFVLQQVKTGVSQNKAVELLFERHRTNRLQPFLMAAMKGAAKADRATPSRSAVCDWCKAYNQAGDIADLLPEHKGRVVEMAAWWGPAIEYYNAPGVKADMAAVWRRLTEVDGFSVTYEQVRSYLNSVPAMYGKSSPARIGKKLYRLTQKNYIRRSTLNALPGDVYAADGYRADVYLAHPVTGDIWRPELTVAIDLRSRMIVGWRADEFESTISVQNMWAEAFARWNHVPPILYVDNGSGYKNKLMNDEMTGFYARAGIQDITHSLPGNPHGKGWIERVFRIIRDDFLKLWNPMFYCGPDVAQEQLNKVVQECKAGRWIPPSLAEFADAFNQWLERYASRPHPEDKSITRKEVWAQLIPIPPAASATELKMQAVTRKVRRASISHGKREYSHPELHAFNDHEVVTEYDLMNDEIAVIRTLDGRWICDAKLVKKMHAIPTSRLEEKRQKALKDSLKRLDKKKQEKLERSGGVIDVEAVARNAEAFLLDPPDAKPKHKPLVLDLTNPD